MAIALQDGNTFIVRTPDKPDQPIPWQGDDPEMMIAALVTKWGFWPIVGAPEIDDDQIVIIKGPVKQDDGSKVFEYVETIPYEKVEKATMPPPMPKKKD